MKQIRTVLCILLICLMAFLLPACSRASKRSRESMDIATLLDGISRYSEFVEMLDKGIPEDLVLTIYYRAVFECTRFPISMDDFINYQCENKVLIGAEKLAENKETLKKISFNVLKPCYNNYPIDAYLYYEFATQDNTLLQVTFVKGTAIDVNGIPVEYDPVFYEIIVPFLSEEDRINYNLDTWKEG